MTATISRACSPEFDHLGVYEVDDDFVAPATPDDVTGHHFRRTTAARARRHHRQPDDRAVARADLARRTPRRRRSCGTGATSCTSATSPRSACPGYAMITPYENATAATRGTCTSTRWTPTTPKRAYQVDDAARRTAHRRPAHRRVEALGVPSAAAHHVREHVRRVGRMRAASDVTTSSTSSAASARTATFSDAPVSDDDDRRASSSAATFAPSAENRQPWEFVVVRDDRRRARIGDLTRRAWESGGRAFSEKRLHAEDARRRRPRRDRRRRGRPRRSSSCAPTSNAGSSRPCRRRSSPPCRTCCSRRPRSGSAAR